MIAKRVTGERQGGLLSHPPSLSLILVFFFLALCSLCSPCSPSLPHCCQPIGFLQLRSLLSLLSLLSLSPSPRYSSADRYRSAADTFVCAADTLDCAADSYRTAADKNARSIHCKLRSADTQAVTSRYKMSSSASNPRYDLNSPCCIEHCCIGWQQINVMSVGCQPIFSYCHVLESESGSFVISWRPIYTHWSGR
jgi:hypothetical protein